MAHSPLHGGRRLLLLDGVLGEGFTDCKSDVGVCVSACPQEGEDGVVVVRQDNVTLQCVQVCVSVNV